MTPSSSPVTAPTETVRIIRQARHAIGEAADVEPDLDIALARLLSQTPDPAGPSDRPLVVKQRIARDRAHLRRLRRTLPDLTDQQSRFEIEAAMRALRISIRAGNQTLDQLVESGRTRRWGPSDFEPGDLAHYQSAWFEVLSVGPVGLTVRFRRTGGGEGWDVPAEYTKLTGRRRNGVEDVDAA